MIRRVKPRNDNYFRADLCRRRTPKSYFADLAARKIVNYYMEEFLGYFDNDETELAKFMAKNEGVRISKNETPTPEGIAVKIRSKLYGKLGADDLKLYSMLRVDELRNFFEKTGKYASQKPKTQSHTGPYFQDKIGMLADILARTSAAKIYRQERINRPVTFIDIYDPLFAARHKELTEKARRNPRQIDAIYSTYFGPSKQAIKPVDNSSALF